MIENMGFSIHKQFIELALKCNWAVYPPFLFFVGRPMAVPAKYNENPIFSIIKFCCRICVKYKKTSVLMLKSCQLYYII